MVEKGLLNMEDIGDYSHLMWKTVRKEGVFSCPIFDVEKVVRRNDVGKEGTFISVNAPEWVVIIPWFRDQKGNPCFIMEKQYRHGSDSITVEFPAGIVEKGEKPEIAALRELLEETGMKAKKLTLLGNVSPNPAFMDNRQFFFLAEELEIVSGQELDENEIIDVFSISVEDVINNMGKGHYDNGIMMAALGFFLREARDRKDLLWKNI